MEIELLACESLGVRSLATVVRTANGVFLIDPGVSLAPRRSSLPPHPVELAASYLARRRIEEAARTADTIILTHYHHDHFTPFAFRRDEWSDKAAALALYRGKRLLGKAADSTLNRNQRRRHATLRENGFELEPADGKSFGDLHFSAPVPHGEEGGNRGCVIMALFEEGDRRFAFASDIQLLNDRAVEVLLEWRPTECILSGPPLYLDVLSPQERKQASERAATLARAIPKLVLDHHLARLLTYRQWIADVAGEACAAGHSVLDGAAFAGRSSLVLEARRKELFSRFPTQSFDYLNALERRDPHVRRALTELAAKLAGSWSLQGLRSELWRCT